MLKRAALAVTAVSLLTAPIRAAETPEAVVKRFYAAVQKAQPSGLPSASQMKALAPVSLSYKDPNNPRDVTRWKDAVILTSEKGREVVDDILFLGDWPFKAGDRLSQVLEARD